MLMHDAKLIPRDIPADAEAVPSEPTEETLYWCSGGSHYTPRSAFAGKSNPTRDFDYTCRECQHQARIRQGKVKGTAIRRGREMRNGILWLECVACHRWRTAETGFRKRGVAANGRIDWSGRCKDCLRPDDKIINDYRQRQERYRALKREISRRHTPRYREQRHEHRRLLRAVTLDRAQRLVERGYSHRMLADLSGVSAHTIYRWLSGDPRLPYATTLERALVAFEHELIRIGVEY